MASILASPARTQPVSPPPSRARRRRSLRIGGRRAKLRAHTRRRRRGRMRRILTRSESSWKSIGHTRSLRATNNGELCPTLTAVRLPDASMIPLSHWQRWNIWPRGIRCCAGLHVALQRTRVACAGARAEMESPLRFREPCEDRARRPVRRLRSSLAGAGGA